MKINPNEMATPTTLKKPELNWLHDYKSCFRVLDSIFSKEGFTGAREYLSKSPLKHVGDYYSEERIKEFKDDFKEGVRKEIYGHPSWVNKVDNQVNFLNQSKSPEELLDALQKLKALF